MLNRALGIKEQGNAEEMREQCQTNEALRSVDPSLGRAESEQKATVTEGQDCYTELYILYIASHIYVAI